jgi:uncharacterized protein
MKATDFGVLKIYASSTDKVGTQLFYEHVVYLARKRGISGVTVNRGVMGYGSSSRHISSSRFWELTEKLPVTIEIVDKTDVLEDFFHLLEPDLLNMNKGCMVSMHPVWIKLQKPGRQTK